MHGADEGKEGTKMKARQVGTHFDCEKWNKKVEKLKFGTLFSPNWCGFGRNGGHCRVECSEADTEVCSKLKIKFFCEKRVRRHRTSN